MVPNIELPAIICVNNKFMQSPREVWDLESVFKSDKNQLAPVEKVPVYVLSRPRTTTPTSHT